MRQLEHAEVDTENRKYPIRLLCADWANPLNVGSAFRLADAAGLTGLILAGTTPTPPNPKIKKTARSTVRSVAFTVEADPVAFARQEKERGTRLLALEITDRSVSLLGYTPPADVRSGERELLLIAGTEANGVSAELLALCDEAVHLPMHGQNSSMNVAVALGAAVYLLVSKF